MSDQMTSGAAEPPLRLGGRPLEPLDWFHLGVLVAAIEGARSVKLDSRDASLGLVGVPDFTQALLAVQHLRRRTEPGR